jgi:dihydrolipoamide dehydrogenase
MSNIGHEQRLRRHRPQRRRAGRALRRRRGPPTYTRAYAESNGFLTLLSDGERLTGAYALGPEAGEWLQQATLAIRAGVPLGLLRDTIHPFPSFSQVYAAALNDLRMEIANMPRPSGRMDAQMAGLSG